MAIDTRLKRSSAMHPGCPWRGQLPMPDGAFAAGDRPMLAYLYVGIGAVSGLPFAKPEGVFVFPRVNRLVTFR